MNSFNSIKLATRTGLSAALCVFALTATAQTEAERNEIRNSYNQTESKLFIDNLDAKAETNQRAVQNYVEVNNIDAQKEWGEDTYAQLQRIAADGTPIYYVVDNAGAAKTTRATALNSGGVLGLNVNGQNMTVGVWDGGPLRLTHNGFGGRASQGDGVTFTSPNGNNGHANHVAGTIGANLNAANGSARGMAYQSSVVGYDWNNDLSEAANAANNGLLVSNHSYGYGVVDGSGRLQIPRHWVGKYDETAADWDNLMANYPYYQMVNAAGNDRQMQANITNKGGYDLLTGHSCSKNAIVVAAAYGVNNYTGPSSVQMSSFSNWGPTDDGRIKPDIAGKGVDVYSIYSNSNNSYANLSGTSMASPNVTGTLALIQQHYKNVNGNFMYASMLRGIAIHTADEAGDADGPDYEFGWGLLNAQEAAEVISGNGTTSIFNSQVLNNGNSYSIDVVAGNGPLEVTICWTDPAASAVNNSTVDYSVSRLVNDLDVRVAGNGNTYAPWILNPSSPSSAATTGDNFRDNVEKVYIANPVAGQTYTITVNHKGSLSGSNQRFAFIVSGIGSSNGGGNNGGGNNGGGATTYCSAQGNSVADEWIAGVEIGSWSNNTPNQPSSGYSDFTGSTQALETGTVNLTLTPGHSGQVYNEYWKIWIDLNEDGDFDDAGEEVFDAGSATGTAVSGSMTIPASAAGVTTRMRVVMRYNTAPEACGSFDYGEVEDYMVEISAPSNGGGGNGGGSATYCDANGTTGYEWISNVQIGAFSNSSTQAQSTAGYTDYTNTVVNMTTGVNAIALTPAYSGSTYSEYWSVWIDFNEDGDFADAGEQVFLTSSGSTTTVSGNITIPANADGVTTRMRIMMRDNATLDPCQTYNYGEVEDYTVNITAGGNSGGAGSTPPSGYCTSNGSNNTYEWIDLVEFGGISNNSGADAGGYGDYTNMTGELEIGRTSRVYFSAGFSNSSYTEYWRIWIDLNRDGDFDDNGEMLLSASSSSSGTLYSDIDIPASAAAGLTRMRVSMKYKATSEPCETFSYGEVEDYLVNLQSGSASFFSPIALNAGAENAEPVTLVGDVVDNSADVLVYPNPATDFVTIEFDRFDTALEYTIYSLEGKEVSTGVFAQRQTTIDVTNLPAGSYYIRTNDGQAQKFIKR